MRILLLVQVCAAHAISHFHIMVLPALVPLLPARYQASFVEIGFAITVFSMMSLIAHIPIGHLTDRIGPRPVLLAGLCLGSASFASLAYVDSYAWLLAAMAAAGVANGVYHPGGYAMISRGVAKARTGRAFSMYTFAGFLGTAVTPAAVYGVLTLGGIELVFLAAAAVGVVGALLFLVPDRSLAPPAREQEAKDGSGRARLFTRPVRVLTLVFTLLSLVSVGTNNFSAAALTRGYSIDLALANVALSALLFTSAFGVLAGGFLADRIARPGLMTAASLLALTVVTTVMAATIPSASLIVAMMAAMGFTFGLVAPSRDLLVRAAAPAGAEGRVFAIVSTGFNTGGAVGPLIFGWLLDNGEPWQIFGVVALFGLLATILTAVQGKA
jgi:MFS family permease